MDFGFLKIGAFSPRTCVANPKQNAIYTLDALRHAQEEGVQVAVLPELCLSSYTCGALFGQDVLLDSCEQALLGLAEQTKGFSTVIVIGIPLRVDGFLYNCAAVLHRGKNPRLCTKDLPAELPGILRKAVVCLGRAGKGGNGPLCRRGYSVWKPAFSLE